VTSCAGVLALSFCLGGTTALAQDLSSLPAYQPAHKISGTIRNFGSEMNGLLRLWEAGFKKVQPGVQFDDKFPSSDAWVSGLEAGVADIGTSGREPMLSEYLSFYETFNYDPLEITVATGAYDIKGRTWAEVVYVNKANPISKLTLKQLDGIFGAPRTGAYRGFKWHPEYARSAKENIRTWGQLGLTGEWADKPIQTYGYAWTGMTNFFQMKVFNGGDKWNENYREYVEYGTKMLVDGPGGVTGSIKHMLIDELSNDKYGIAWTGIPHAADVSDVKPVALAEAEGKPYVMATKETVQNRTYPLTRSIYFFLKRAPGQPLDPTQREFVRYILSRQGQEDVVRNGNYLPLTASVIAEMRRKLE
jgi:phosphate transport system substrate-binding protein